MRNIIYRNESCFAETWYTLVCKCTICILRRLCVICASRFHVQCRKVWNFHELPMTDTPFPSPSFQLFIFAYFVQNIIIFVEIYIVSMSFWNFFDEISFFCKPIVSNRFFWYSIQFFYVIQIFIRYRVCFVNGIDFI